MRITETVKLSRGRVECSSNQVRTEDMVLTVGIELLVFKRAELKNKHTSQQYSQQLFRNECCLFCCPYGLLSLVRPVIDWWLDS